MGAARSRPSAVLPPPPPPPPELPLRHATLADFSVERIIGIGGFGRVSRSPLVAAALAAPASSCWRVLARA